MKYRFEFIAVAAAASLAASGAAAATARAGVSGGPPSAVMSAPGFATAEMSFMNGFAQANAYEFKAGIGLSAFAAATGSSSRNTSASSSAAFSDSYVITDSLFLPELADAIFQVDFKIRADGTTSSSSTTFPGNPAFQSQTASSYQYNWSTGGVSGSGHHQSDKLLDREIVEIHQDSFKGGTLLVRVGETINVSFSASALAGAFSLPDAPGNAATNFDHTLAWEGITGISARNAAGDLIDLPSDFRLSMVSPTTGFDYWYAAGPNPFTTPGGVPEPATWAMMLVGFFGLGSVVRSRRGLSARTAA